MKKIKLHTPTIEELSFRQECMSDPKTMAYNAGYNVFYEGYHFDTGCIDFPKEKWETWYNEKILRKEIFYAYILDVETNNFVGYVNFKKDSKSNKATMGIVVHSKYQGMGYMRPAMEQLISKAKENGVVALTDTVPNTREKALKVFFDLGFKKVGEFTSKKFNKDEIVFEIEKTI